MTGDFCEHCQDLIVGVPVTDPDEMFWLRGDAEKFCSTECRDYATDEKAARAHP